MAINNEEATLDTPPPNLPPTLMPARSSDVNPFRKAKKSSPTPSTSNTSNSTIMTPSFIPFPMPGYPPYPSMYPSLPGMHQSSMTPVVHTSSRTDPEDITIRSSPPMEIDPVDRLQRYFTWLISRSPSQVEMFTKAKIAALKAGHTFSTIFKLSDDKWAQWDIEDGIVMQIRMGESKFKKAEQSFNI